MLVLLPRKSRRLFVYAVDVENGEWGLVVTKRADTKIKKLTSYGASEEVYAVKRYVFVREGRFLIPPGRNEIILLTAAAFKRLLEKVLSFRILEEQKYRKPAEIFFLYRWFDRNVHTYFTITSNKVYAQGFEQKFLTAKRFIVLRRILLVIA